MADGVLTISTLLDIASLDTDIAALGTSGDPEVFVNASAVTVMFTTLPPQSELDALESLIEAFTDTVANELYDEINP